MRQFHSSFKLKLLLFSMVLFAVIATLAVALFVSTERYQYYLERSTAANRVLSSVQAVSDHAYRKLNALEQIVATGQVQDVAARVQNEKLLWEAMAQTRQYLSAEYALDGSDVDQAMLDRISELEALAEGFIRSGGAIRDAIQAGDLAGAQTILDEVRSAPASGRFNQLIDEALVEERQLVETIQADTLALGSWINRAVTLVLIVTLAFGLGVVVLISRRLTHSLDGLARAADAYRDGALEHRTEALPEVEFAKLGDAFNQMARELSTRRLAAQRSQEQLEEQVQERTQALQQTLRQLELADASRRQLLADISHELRTPLTIVRGEADMALRGQQKSAEEYVDALRRVREQAIHTTRLVEDLLFVARAEEGNLRLELRAVAVLDLLQEVCADFRSALDKKRLQLAQQIPQHRLIVQGDSGRLRQVLAILLDNAIRYANEDTTVDIEVQCEAPWLHIRIRNAGIGLSEEEAKQVFFRFYRGDGAAGQSEGTGLGLPVAKAIVEAHGGSISLSGQPGVGATAYVQLPVEKPVSAVA